VLHLAIVHDSVSAVQSEKAMRVDILPALKTEGRRTIQ
jgi:hypothetical protein